MDSDQRYIRQVDLPEIGSVGQKKLAAAKVLVIGAGGLGSPLLFALAGAGVGHLTIIDPDLVSPDNLNRQFLYRDNEIGRPKARCAANRLLAYNPGLQVLAVCDAFTAGNGRAFTRDHDLVVAAVDHAASRQAINQAACAVGRPLVDGGISGLNGYLAVIEPGRTPCYQCLFPDRHLSGKTQADKLAPVGGAVLGSVAGVIGSLQATAALELLLGLANPLAGSLLYFHGRSLTFSRQLVSRNPDCPVCGRLFTAGLPAEPDTGRPGTERKR